MMKSMILILVVALISSSAARHVKWTMNEDVVDATTPFNFKFVLAQQNLDVLDSMFWQISDPYSPLFGKFLTNEQIADLISLPEADIQAVENYIKKDAGKFCDVEVKRNVHRDYLYVSTCVGQAQVMFPNLKLSVYERENSVQTVLRSKRLLQDVSSNLHFLGVPHELHHLISGIHDVTDTPVPVEHVSKTFDPFLPWQKSDKELTIAEMRETFNVTWDGIEDSTLEEDDGQVRQAVVEFFHNNFSSSELAAYQQKYGMPINPIRKVVGTQNFSEENSVEASLDVQTITGISGNVHTWDFVFGDSLCWLDMVETVTTTPGAPKVLSCSWGNFESLVNKSKVAPVNAAFMKLGLAGFTFLIAAGDSGPSLQQNCEYYDPQFPATSPYVVSVGGTKIDKTTGVEGAWFNSSGGFSFLVDRPDFQQEKVAAYLDKAKMPPNAGGKVYNTVGRAFPDVSAFGAYQPVLANGTYQPVGGTSSATPQFTAVLALINIHRYQKGLGPLGPLTQTFWTLEKGVGFDVTVGSSYATFNQGGDTCKDVYLPGYETLPGWDPVTGIGSPKFDVLLEQLLNIPGESK